MPRTRRGVSPELLDGIDDPVKLGRVFVQRIPVPPKGTKFRPQWQVEGAGGSGITAVNLCGDIVP